MNWKTFTFVGILATFVSGSFYLSYSGAMLPGPDESSKVTMRDVGNRRAHFMRYYAFGK